MDNNNLIKFFEDSKIFQEIKKLQSIMSNIFLFNNKTIEMIKNISKNFSCLLKREE